MRSNAFRHEVQCMPFGMRSNAFRHNEVQPGRVVQTYITSGRDFASDQNLASDGTFGTFCAIPPTQFPIPSMPVALEFVWRAWLLCLWHCPLQLPIHPSRALQFSPEVRSEPAPRRVGAWEQKRRTKAHCDSNIAFYDLYNYV